jgi:tRNA-splicing ligase RtcB (3'-phosphate/5'-hydroxy nucleic acid ligase)
MKKIISDTKVPVKIWTNEIEHEAEMQLRKLANLPFIHKHVAVMPDVHHGKGSTVGTVIATKGAIIPAAVGVDIGCGMMAVKLPFSVNELGGDAALKALRHSIERSIPTGHNSNKDLTASAKLRCEGLTDQRDALVNRLSGKAALQLGTLGGGNHFIEICKDQNNDAWIMLHSGSRNIGKVLAEKHIDVAKGIMKQYFIDLPDPDLAYLAQGTTEFKAYLSDLLWAQEYAKQNRLEMMDRVIKDVSYHVYNDTRLVGAQFEYNINCHHNYTAMENHFGQNVWITRKGAVSASAGKLGIIPGSMGAKSYIVEGLGNEESFCSCSHGAGRKMSRTKANAMFTEKDLADQTNGIECRKDSGIVDELPAAYKNIETVMANQADLVKPLFTLNQLICVKG